MFQILWPSLNIWTLPCFFRVLLHQFFIDTSWNLKFKSKERYPRNNYNQLCMEDRKKNLFSSPMSFASHFIFLTAFLFSLVIRFFLLLHRDGGRSKNLRGHNSIIDFLFLFLFSFLFLKKMERGVTVFSSGVLCGHFLGIKMQ